MRQAGVATRCELDVVHVEWANVAGGGCEARVLAEVWVDGGGEACSEKAAALAEVRGRRSRSRGDGMGGIRGAG
jgi:hypothetical protein